MATIVRGDSEIDSSTLHKLCTPVSGTSAPNWERIEEWLDNEYPDVTKKAAEYAGEQFETRALHVVCRHKPPVVIIEKLLLASEQTVEWPDAFGWLPLHYAAGNGASVEVLRTLINRFPGSKVKVDKRQRTPLHFAVGSVDHPVTTEVAEILSDSGAVGLADENGSYPIHYACAYGARVEVVKVLLDAWEASIYEIDGKGSTALHFVMGNADRASSVEIIDYVLEKDPTIINKTDDSKQLPLQLLANQAKRLPDDAADSVEKRTNTYKCLERYLKAKPVPNAEFFTALQLLPDWLLDKAVILDDVQKILNNKISQIFPTAMLLMDLYVYLMLIICYTYAIHDFREYQHYDSSEPMGKYYELEIGLLFLGAAYFSFREFLQMISLITIDSFSSWYSDTQNMIDTVLILLVIFSALILNESITGFNEDDVRIIFSVTTAVLYLSVLAFLRSTMMEFAVFVRGVSYVAQMLTSFLMALMIILIMFSVIFLSIHRNTEYCPKHLGTDRLQELMEEQHVLVPDDPAYNQSGYICSVYDDVSYTRLYTSVESDTTEVETIPGETFCTDIYMKREELSEFPFCEFGSAFLRINTMLFGEVEKDDFLKSPIAIYFFFLFLLTVVILLANVLIAIVTDSYYVIRDQKAAIVFWNNRLDFVSEMDTIKFGVLKIFQSCYGCGTSEDEDPTVDFKDFSVGNPSRSKILKNDNVGIGSGMWNALTEHAKGENRDGADTPGPAHFEFWLNIITRTVAMILIVIWLIIGVGSFGALWPPEVREAVLVTNTKNDVENDAFAEIKKSFDEVTDKNTELRKEIKELQSILKEYHEKAK